MWLAEYSIDFPFLSRYREQLEDAAGIVAQYLQESQGVDEQSAYVIGPEFHHTDTHAPFEEDADDLEGLWQLFHDNTEIAFAKSWELATAAETGGATVGSFTASTQPTTNVTVTYRIGVEYDSEDANIYHDEDCELYRGFTVESDPENEMDETMILAVLENNGFGPYGPAEPFSSYADTDIDRSAIIARDYL